MGELAGLPCESGANLGGANATIPETNPRTDPLRKSFGRISNMRGIKMASVNIANHAKYLDELKVPLSQKNLDMLALNEACLCKDFMD